MGRPDKNDWYHAVHADPPTVATVEVVTNLVAAEVHRSFELHGCPLWGRHEAYAIIKEEVDEMWEEVKKDGESKDLAIELIQIAAICIRYLSTMPKWVRQCREEGLQKSTDSR